MKKLYQKPSMFVNYVCDDVIRTSGKNDGVMGFDSKWLDGGLDK